MKLWLIAPWCTAEDMVALAKQAEDLGYEGVMGADHAFVPKTMAKGYLYSSDGTPPIHRDMPYPDVWTTLAAMASVTSRIKLSTAVYVLPLRHPIEVAKATATLARLSNNRVILGAGAGWMQEEFDVYGVDFRSRGRRMDEMIDVMRKLWTGSDVEYAGEFFNFPSLKLCPAPTQSVPIYIGGASPVALKRAARLGQGWIGAGNDIDEVPAILNTLQQHRKAFGTEQSPFETVIAVNQLQETDKVKRLEELGMTSAVCGFPDYTAPLREKLELMERFAEHLIPVLSN